MPKSESAPKSILILSYGPVPTPEYQKIEGGGMRCWGLAQGLRKNGANVTVGVNEGFPQKNPEHDGIKLINWHLNDAFKSVLNAYDAVVVSYCMGDLSMFVADYILPETLLILDAYVPIYIEVSARNSDDKAGEYFHYQQDIVRFNHVLRRGDYFLCANQPQKHMYAGILGSLGVINPYTYHQDRLLVIPFGIESEALPVLNKGSNPYLKLGIKESDFVLLWFGGLYPWFDFKPMVKAIEALTEKHINFKFVLVGGKNPFNNHPDFVSQYEFVSEQLAPLVGKSCFFVDWVDFDQRALWYQGASVVVSINSPGEENTYAWRTRVMDYVWGEVPIVTNGGDPLSDLLTSKGAAIKVGDKGNELAEILGGLISDSSKLDEIKAGLTATRKMFFWETVTYPLLQKISSNFRPFDDEEDFAARNGLQTAKSESPSPLKIRLKRYKRYVSIAQDKGIKKSVRFGMGILKAKTKSTLDRIRSDGERVILISHPIDETGAPLVLLSIADDFAKKFSPSKIHIASSGIKKYLLRGLLSKGYVFHRIAEGVGRRIIHAQLNVKFDDFVLLNTVAIHNSYKEYVFKLLEEKKLKKATWFIHEDKPEIRLTNKTEVKRVRALLESGKLDIRVPSIQTAKEYNSFLNSGRVLSTTLRVEVPEQYKSERKLSDYEKIDFTISGTPSDGRKGQLLFLAALARFELIYKTKSPTNYRDYGATFVSIGDDYISEQIKAVGLAQLGKDFKYYEKIPREDALEIAHKCNVTVCTSLNETFALYVAEGMMMGHVILRNHSSGWNEQMKDGVNGYLVKDLDVEDLSKKIEKILNKKSHPNKKLMEMGKSSQEIARSFETADYYSQLYDKK
ncbi:MAG TPA: glycosyltransferase [Gammaproteobacteria bacterium]|nr:glycosyltransferase [Gammaproteobacteria bacterium]